MVLMLAFLMTLLSVVAAVVATAAARNGLVDPVDSADSLAQRVAQQRKHIAEIQIRPTHARLGTKVR